MPNLTLVVNNGAIDREPEDSLVTYDDLKNAAFARLEAAFAPTIPVSTMHDAASDIIMPDVDIDLTKANLPNVVSLEELVREFGPILG